MKSVLSSRLEKEKGKWTDASKDAVNFFAEVFEWGPRQGLEEKDVSLDP